MVLKLYDCLDGQRKLLHLLNKLFYILNLKVNEICTLWSVDSIVKAHAQKEVDELPARSIMKSLV